MNPMILVMIHILVCIILYVLMRLRVLKCSRMVMMLAFFVPVWGVGCLVVLEIRTRGKQEMHGEIGIEKLKINDEIHRSILLEEDPTEGRVVPLEEALLINDPAIRRELMMEVMYSNPDDYVQQLQEARMNDDTEVVHYAVTALMELQKSYDFQFQELDYKMAKNPDDRKLREQYLELTEKYLDSGLPEGNAKNIQLRRYAQILGKKLETEPDNIRVYCSRADAYLRIGEYENAYQDIEKIMMRWPADERGYLLLIQYNSLIKDREGIDRILELIKKRQVHLSPAGRSTVAFWNA